MFLINKKSDMCHEEFVKYHKQKHAPMVANALGKHIKSCTACYADQTFSLEEGLLPERLYDAVVFARFDDEFWKGKDAWRKTPEGVKIAEDGERFMDWKSGVAMECRVKVFIP